jgi:hypothetical protein
VFMARLILPFAYLVFVKGEEMIVHVVRTRLEDQIFSIYKYFIVYGEYFNFQRVFDGVSKKFIYC